MAKVREFVLDSEGQCFFCLIQILNPSSPIKTSEHYKESACPSFTSIHCFSRYLGMKMRKVFNENGTIPLKLISTVERSNLTVELCEDCATTIDKFSKLYEQFEKIELEMGFYLKHIQRKLTSAEGKKMTKFNSTAEFKGKQEIVEVLRTESLEKCSDKLCMSVPTIKVQNLTMSQLKKKSGKLRNNVSFRERKKQEHGIALRSPATYNNLDQVPPKEEYDDSDYSEIDHDNSEPFDNLDLDVDMTYSFSVKQPHSPMSVTSDSSDDYYVSQTTTKTAEMVILNKKSNPQGPRRTRINKNSFRYIKDKRLRKKEQNTYAAARYRQKKKEELAAILIKEEKLQVVHNDLERRKEKLGNEIRITRRLLREMIRARKGGKVATVNPSNTTSPQPTSRIAKKRTNCEFYKK